MQETRSVHDSMNRPKSNSFLNSYNLYVMGFRHVPWADLENSVRGGGGGGVLTMFVFSHQICFSRGLVKGFLRKRKATYDFLGGGPDLPSGSHISSVSKNKGQLPFMQDLK